MNIEKLTQGGFSIGVELPLDNDWSASGDALRERDGRPFGVPDMSRHAELIRQADKLGFRAAWVRDVPLYDPDFGDAAQVFETFTYIWGIWPPIRTIFCWERRRWCCRCATPSWYARQPRPCRP